MDSPSEQIRTLEAQLAAARSDLHRCQERLFGIEQRFSLTFENAPIAITVCDGNGRILRVNPEVCSMLGYSEKELVGKSYDVIAHPEDAPQSRETFKKLAAGSTGRIVQEVRFLRKDGETVHALMHSGVIPATDDHPAEIVAQVVDHTPQVMAKEEAEQHRERLAQVDRVSTMGEMAAGIAHEINQPLTAIATFAQASRRLIRDGCDAPEDILDALEQINDQALRAGEVIRRLRTLVRKRESTRNLTEINDLIRDIAKLAEVDARIYDFGIRLELTEGALAAVVDPVQIQQVVLNLIRNGMDAMQGYAESEDALIVRTILREDEKIEVTVQDLGAGIADGSAPELFKPFFTTKSSGMGLGLSISRSIITSHGGVLWFIRNPDRGMSFHFTLPTAMGATHEEA